MNPLTFGWHAGDVLLQASKAPRWFRVVYALVGLAGNVIGTEDSVARANAKVRDWHVTHSDHVTHN